MPRKRRKPEDPAHVTPEGRAKRKVKTKLRPIERALEEAKSVKKH